MTIIAEKTIGENYDIIVVDHDPRVTNTDGCAGCLIIGRHRRNLSKWFIKLTDGDNTDVEPISFHRNLTATTVPGRTNGASEGFDVGSDWLNTSTGKWYKCRSSSDGAAVWDILN